MGTQYFPKVFDENICNVCYGYVSSDMVCQRDEDLRGFARSVVSVLTFCMYIEEYHGVGNVMCRNSYTDL